MTRYLTRDWAAIVAALVAPLAAAAILLPFRASWPNTNVALLLVVVVVVVAAARLERDGTVLAGRGRWDVETVGLPGGEIELRVFGSGRYYGRFMMRPKPDSRPSLQARLVAVTLAEQAGRALAAAAPASSTG